MNLTFISEQLLVNTSRARALKLSIHLWKNQPIKLKTGKNLEVNHPVVFWYPSPPNISH